MRIKSLFTVPEGTKVTEKAFSKVLLSSICSILLCMACLMSTTWAWFTVSIENTENVIQIADVQTDINVSGTNVVAHNDGSYTLGAGTYTVTITVTSDGTDMDSFRSRSPVYMTMYTDRPVTNVVTVDESQSGSSYTVKLVFVPGTDSERDEATKTITLNVPTDDTKVNFQLSWVQPDGAIPVEAEPAVIGDAPATEPTETTAPPESTGTGETTDPSETTVPPESTGNDDPAETTGASETTGVTDPTATSEPTDPPATSEPPASTEVTDPPATSEPTATGEPAETEKTESTT